LGVALFISLQAYSTGYRQAAREPLDLIGADLAIQRQGDVPEAFAGPVFPHSVAPIHSEEINAISRIDGVEAISEAVFFWDFEPDRFLVVLGFAPPSSTSDTVGPGRLQAAILDGRFLAPEDRGVAVADASYAQQNNLGLGDSVPVAGRPFVIVGLVDTSRAGQVANANIYIPLADAREIASAAPNVRSIFDFRETDANILFVKANQAQAESVEAAATKVIGDKALVSSARSFSTVLGSSFRLIDQFGWLVGLAGLLIAVAGMLRALASNFWERRRDISLMRVVGWRRTDIVRQLMSEALALSLMGGLAGIGIAELVTLILNRTQVTIPVPWELSPTPHFLPGGAHEISVTIPLPASVGAGVALLTLVLAMVCGTGISIFLARRAANKKPAEALND